MVCSAAAAFGGGAHPWAGDSHNRVHREYYMVHKNQMLDLTMYSELVEFKKGKVELLSIWKSTHNINKSCFVYLNNVELS